jgi:hypothetical protein
MDYLVLGPFLLDKRRQPQEHRRIRWDQEFELD